MAAPGLHSLCLKSLCPFISPGLPVKKKKSANCRNCSAERWGPGGLQTSPFSLPACQQDLGSPWLSLSSKTHC